MDFSKLTVVELMAIKKQVKQLIKDKKERISWESFSVIKKEGDWFWSDYLTVDHPSCVMSVARDLQVTMMSGKYRPSPVQSTIVDCLGIVNTKTEDEWDEYIKEHVMLDKHVMYDINGNMDAIVISIIIYYFYYPEGSPFPKPGTTLKTVNLDDECETWTVGEDSMVSNYGTIYNHSSWKEKSWGYITLH